MKTYTLIGADGRAHASTTPGTLGGHRGNRVYGRLDCPGALRWIARGHYVEQRVFFADEPTAIAAGYRPCATCMPAEHRTWKDRRDAMLHTVVETPIGPLLLGGDPDGTIARLTFADEPPPAAAAAANGAPFAAAREQLAAYFAGELTAFDLTLRLDGSAFERRVWAALREIPHGTTTTYGELAGRIGEPGKARAVGWANSRNPVAIVVPCHRVVGARGALTGYAGGLDRKRALLVHEGALLA